MKRKRRICKYPRCYAVYTASAEAQAASWGGGADDFADWYNTLNNNGGLTKWLDIMVGQ